MAQLDVARCVADGRLSLANLSGAGVGAGPNPVASVATFAAKPVALSDGRLMIEHTTALLRAFEASPDWPTYKASAPPYPQEIADTTVRHILAKIMLPSFERATLVYFRNVADRRMTATALAARGYALDYEGKLPAKLDDLVPTYLAAIPLDPFAPAPQPLKYVNDPEKPVIYSVGEDGVDGGGSELSAKTKANPRNQTRWDKLDAVVHLKARPRELPKEQEEEADDAPAGMEPLTAPTTAPANPL
jgi:hypothetical protein